MLPCVVKHESPDCLEEYAKVPTRFEVCSVFQFDGDDPQAAGIKEQTAAVPWTKDYDAVAGEQPPFWAKRWDLSEWGILAAYVEGQRVGGCAVANGHADLVNYPVLHSTAVLWDIRIHPAWRGCQIGRQLFEAALQWAREHDCTELVTETQNVNVPACKFYQRQGCRLVSIRPHAYATFPDEIELIWKLQL